MTHLTASIVGAGLADQVALLTDGRFGGGTQGISVGHISPEAADGGPLAILRDGDVVEIDAEANRLHVELARRRDRRPPRDASSTRRRATRPACSRSTRASSARPRPVPGSVPEWRASPAASTRSRRCRASTSGSGS